MGPSGPQGISRECGSRKLELLNGIPVLEYRRTVREHRERVLRRTHWGFGFQQGIFIRLRAFSSRSSILIKRRGADRPTNMDTEGTVARRDCPSVGTPHGLRGLSKHLSAHRC